MNWLSLFLAPAIELLSKLLEKKLVTETDHRRAETIGIIASTASDALVIANPTKPWAELVDLVVDEIADRLPTSSRKVAYAEAKAAVLRALKAYRGQVDPLPG